MLNVRAARVGLFRVVQPAKPASEGSIQYRRTFAGQAARLSTVQANLDLAAVELD